MDIRNANWHPSIFDYAGGGGAAASQVVQGEIWGNTYGKNRGERVKIGENLPNKTYISKCLFVAGGGRGCKNLTSRLILLPPKIPDLLQANFISTVPN